MNRILVPWAGTLYLPPCPSVSIRVPIKTCLRVPIAAWTPRARLVSIIEPQKKRRDLVPQNPPPHPATTGPEPTGQRTLSPLPSLAGLDKTVITDAMAQSLPPTRQSRP
jgi:hypothetical protein